MFKIIPYTKNFFYETTKLFSLIVLLSLAGIIACNQEEKKEPTDAMASNDGSAHKIELVKSFYPLFEKGDWAAIEKITSADFTDHNPWAPGGSVSSRDTLMKYLKMSKEAFPDMKIEPLHAAVDGDMVFVHYRFTGTNTGPMMGMPATNKKIDYMGVDLIRVKDSVATEHWDYGDNITYMRQMGMMPEQK